jgi:hypothetical protein
MGSRKKEGWIVRHPGGGYLAQDRPNNVSLYAFITGGKQDAYSFPSAVCALLGLIRWSMERGRGIPTGVEIVHIEEKTTTQETIFTKINYVNHGRHHKLI